MICPGIGVEPEKLRLIQNGAGGTFGYKFCPTMEALLGVACLATGRPVSLSYSQYQNITYTGKRSPGNVKIKLGADKNGKLVAMETDWWIDHGPYSEFGDLLTVRQAQFIGAGYDIAEHPRAAARRCAPIMRGDRRSAPMARPRRLLASETAMDMLAEKMGIDPFDLRYRNIYRSPATTPTGQTPDVYCLEGIFDELSPKYEEAKKRCKEFSTPEKPRGVGLALGVYGCGLDGPDGSEASVELTGTGVTLFNSWQDHGQGADLAALTIAHETLRPLGIAPEQIKLEMNDTLLPNSGPSGGSRSNVFTGNATSVSCEMLLNAMRKPDGTYRTYDEMVAEKIPLRYDGKWVASDCTACDSETGQGNPFPVYMYEIFMPEVEVNRATGKVARGQVHDGGGCGHDHQPLNRRRPDLWRPCTGCWTRPQ